MTDLIHPVLAMIIIVILPEALAALHYLVKPEDDS